MTKATTPSCPFMHRRPTHPHFCGWLLPSHATTRVWRAGWILGGCEVCFVVPFGGLSATWGPMVSKISTTDGLLGFRYFFKDAKIVEAKQNEQQWWVVDNKNTLCGASGVREPEDWAAEHQDLRVSEAPFQVKWGMALVLHQGPKKDLGFQMLRWDLESEGTLPLGVERSWKSYLVCLDLSFFICKWHKS